MIKFFTENAIFVLFLLLFVGTILGSIKIKGISLGTSAVLLAALVFGNFGFTLPKELTDLGLTLFVYAVGLQAGPGFIKSFKLQGKALVVTSIVAVTAGWGLVILLSQLLHIPHDIAAGLFAGSLTNTPALAAGMGLAPKLHWSLSNLSAGYGIAYPFSVVSVILTIQLLPRLFKANLKKEEAAIHALEKENSESLVRKHFIIENPNCFNKTLKEINVHDRATVTVSRVFHNHEFSVATATSVLQKNDIITVIGTTEDIEKIGVIFGKEVDINLDDSQIASDDITVFATSLVGKKLKELKLWKNYAVSITRIHRQDYEFTPLGSYELEYGDIIRVVGLRHDVEQFGKFASSSDHKTHETDLLTFLFGLVLGAGFGIIPFTIPNGPTITIGMAAGAFIVSLIIGHFRKIGPYRLYVPQAASNIARELGLMIFLASAGSSAGSKFVPVFQKYGISLVVAGGLITLITIIISVVIMRLVFKFNYFSVTGGLSGIMTNPPALAAAKQQTTLDTPVIAYATIYPFVMILKIALIQILMLIMQNLR